MAITDSFDPALVAPFVVLSIPVLYFTYRVYRGIVAPASSRKTYNPKTGIGRGAPGFQTGVKKVAIPPELAARIRAGEDVSAEEVTAALDAERERIRKEEEDAERIKNGGKKLPANVDEDWLQDGSFGSPSSKSKVKKRK
ncbi:uncharacterized protein JCM15063_001049 [Sporobolomyces koalae]|uniref:uncharacterized protein n=1 Tax=Sporobolomyces koalae TaxID=500713 RepID=UPI00318257B5